MEYIQGLTRKELSKWTGKEWYHQRFDGSPYFIHFIAEAQIDFHIERKKGTNFDVHYCFFENGKADWYMEMEDIKKIYTAVIKNGGGDISYSTKFIAEWDGDEKAFYALCEHIGETDLAKLTDKELITLHNEFVETVLSRNSSSSTIDGFALGTDEIVAAHIKKLYDASPLKDTMRLNELFSILTAPVHLSFINEAEVSLIKIALAVRKDPAQRTKLLQRHQQEFFWIHNNYVDAYVLSVEHFNTELEKLLALSEDLNVTLKKIEETPARHIEEKKKYWSLVEQDKELEFLLKVSEDFTKWQDDRKKATLWTMHYGSLILSEIGKRTNISLELIKYMSPREVGKIFDITPSSEDFKKRKENCVFFWDTEGHEVLVGKEADQVKETILKTTDLSHVNDFRGLTACMGKGVGTVKIIKSAKEVDKVNEGDILVAVMTRPDYVPAMKKAAAIVTDEGGVTSHAAIVARELNKPCVIGTKIATKVLKDGMTVEVNADHGLVSIL